MGQVSLGGLNDSAGWTILSWLERQVSNIHIYKYVEYSVQEVNSTSDLYRTKIQSNYVHLFTRNLVSVS